MRVTKRADLLAKMKREEAERRAEQAIKAYLDADKLEFIASDCFDALVMLSEVCLRNVPFDESIHADVYDQLEALRVRMDKQGIVSEWRHILPDYLKGTYGS